MITFYFDGLCPLCTAEANYQTTKFPGRVYAVDVTVDGSALQDAGISRQAALRLMHLRMDDGSWRIGGDAVLALFALDTGYRNWLGKALNLPGLRQGFSWLYKTVVPYRPRRKCANQFTGAVFKKKKLQPSSRGTK